MWKNFLYGQPSSVNLKGPDKYGSVEVFDVFTLCFPQRCFKVMINFIYAGVEIQSFELNTLTHTNLFMSHVITFPSKPDVTRRRVLVSYSMFFTQLA